MEKQGSFSKTFTELASEQMNDLDELAKLKQDAALQDELDQISDSLQKGLPDTLRPIIPERYFVGIYLPWFAGEEVIVPTPEGGGVKMNSDHWIAVAGHHAQEVDVLDEHGNVLYSVPPMVNSMQILTNYDKVGYSLTSVFKRYKEEADIYPQVAKDNLKHELDRTVSVEVKEIKDEYARRWYDIFKRYGYIDNVAGEVNGVPEATSPGEKVEPTGSSEADQLSGLLKF